jgi:hypothetical protein
MVKKKTKSDSPAVTDVRYYARIRGEVNGPFRVQALRKVPGFTLQTLVCAEGLEQWTPAYETIDLKAYFWTATPGSTYPTPFDKSGLHDLLSALDHEGEPPHETPVKPS